ncbi:hypothetical protein [Nonomuraea sp. NPDC050540]|uniref:hypothetical protein n=1 Tax=Nonomuraea sp. NPDC050540 TaxID=3364367 RepID=UPI0037998D4C
MSPHPVQGDQLSGRGVPAGLESFDLAEPAFALSFGDAVVQVVADLLEAGPLGGVRPQE